MSREVSILNSGVIIFLVESISWKIAIHYVDYDNVPLNLNMFPPLYVMRPA